jgi:hypothetical protein
MAKQTGIDVRSAVLAAIGYLQELDEFVSTSEIRLEETERDDAGDWLITPSTLDPAEGGIMSQLAPPKRNYKIFRIDALTAEVKSMKVRTLQPIE